MLKLNASHLSSLHILALAAVLASCATSLPPAATNPSETANRADELFASMDLDGDGFLTRSELDGGIRYLARGLESGPATGSDLMLGIQGKNNAKKRAKKQTSRTLTSEQMNKAVQEAFAVRDENLDNRLSKEEFRKVVVERETSQASGDLWESLM